MKTDTATVITLREIAMLVYMTVKKNKHGYKLPTLVGPFDDLIDYIRVLNYLGIPTRVVPAEPQAYARAKRHGRQFSSTIYYALTECRT